MTIIAFFDAKIFNNYSPKWRWIVVDINRAAKLRVNIHRPDDIEFFKYMDVSERHINGKWDNSTTPTRLDPSVV